MRPVALAIQAFRGWRERVELKLAAPITAIVAANKAGKSSTLNAIEWCLFGDVISGKGSSGIGERVAWEIYPRDGASGPTEVRLVLRTPEGEAVVTRRAPADGDKKGAGTFEVRTPGGSCVSGTQAESWLRENGLPDWETYRRAHCFHQESARTRVIDSKRLDFPSRSSTMVSEVALASKVTSSANAAGARRSANSPAETCARRVTFITYPL